MKIYKVCLFILITLFLSACLSDNENTETGELSIELTDAKGDFTNYTIDLLSLTLTQKNGRIIETLPETTRIDFSQYVDMSEFLTLATIPQGIYTSATLHLDYQNADIYVEDANGSSIKVNTLVDEDGVAVTSLSAKVLLVERNQLFIAPGVPAHLSLDFDLKTSNSVSFDENDSPSITVSPTLRASLEPELDKTHRIRGPLKSVDVDNASFDLIVRPFNRKMKTDREQERFGKLRIQTNDTTNFEVDGVPHIGTDGITALEALSRLTAVIVIGDISLNPRRFTATEVYAGESVPGGNKDTIKGTVLSRNGDTLIVRGATLVRTDGSVFFNDNVSILLNSETPVKRQNSKTAYTIADISVGQAVTIFGTLNEDTDNLTLDASSGSVRMRITRVSGTVVENSSAFEVDLKNINGRKVKLYDFSGTGINPENDADPAFYAINTGNLNTRSFTLSSPVNVRGFVNSFGQAPDDFIAKTIVGMEGIKAVMHTNWRPTSTTAFSDISENGISLDFTGKGKFHHLSRGYQRLDISELDEGFTLAPGEFSDGIYVIHLNNSQQVHASFASFANDLQDQMNAGSSAKKIKGKGLFDHRNGSFSAKSLQVHLQ